MCVISKLSCFFILQPIVVETPAEESSDDEKFSSKYFVLSSCSSIFLKVAFFMCDFHSNSMCFVS